MAGGEAAPIVETKVSALAGIELFVRSRGDGTDVLFLHGSMAHGIQSLWLLGGLSDNYRVICPDIRGRGSSVCRGVGEYSWAHFAADVATVLDAFEIDRAIIGGTSLGAGIALSFALMNPARIAGLVAMGSPFAGAEDGWSAHQRGAYDASAHAAQRVRELGLADAVKELGAGMAPDAVEATRSRWAQHDEQSITAALIAEATLPQPFSLADLAAIEVPVLVLPGGDMMHPRSVSHSYMPHLQHGTLREVPIPPQPNDVVSAIKEWLSEEAPNG